MALGLAGRKGSGCAKPPPILKNVFEGVPWALAGLEAGAADMGEQGAFSGGGVVAAALAHAFAKENADLFRL